MVREKTIDQDDETTFDVLFRGEIFPDNNVDRVRALVAKSFKLDEAAINQLFSGAVISLKRNVDRATAERIHQRLYEAGAVANIVPSAVMSRDGEKPDNAKIFTVAPLGADVLDGADVAKQDPLTIAVDHLGLEPIGSNIIEADESEAIEPREVDTSHLSLE